MKELLGCFGKNYATFRGRARRKEYFLFMISFVLISIFVIIIEFNANSLYSYQGSFPIPILVTVVFLLLLIPGTAVTVRRLHDTNRSWSWILIAYIPTILFMLLQGFASVAFYMLGKGIIYHDHFSLDIIRNVYFQWGGYDVSCVISITSGHCASMLVTLAAVASLFGFIWLWILMCLKGTEGENRFGPDPLASSTTGSGETA